MYNNTMAKRRDTMRKLITPNERRALRNVVVPRTSVYVYIHYIRFVPLEIAFSLNCSRSSLILLAIWLLRFM